MAAVSKACCVIPPVISQGYQAKGEYKTLDGLQTYITGPPEAAHAILIIYDIFGFSPQILQGADLMATADTHREYRVFMPDFFEGSPADGSWFASQSNEAQQKVGNFFQTKAAPPRTLSKIPGVIEDANKLSLESNTVFSTWAIMGYCWGGKVANLTLKSPTAFKVAAQLHPAMLDPEDAKNVDVPMVLLASKDEDQNAVEKYKNNLHPVHHVETIPTQIHGWMAARADLKDTEVGKEYQRGYKTVLKFFHQYL
ncbi:putative hydrolase [Rhizodiscina lignyota]|uniref:Hydrolase n=1 Tax=Rhizodiscina lignyota TaxID=1504668 RepID=A0A9P4I7L2_9PEZI|nr:putative hydrolase [Rhizodiscina lignyota]